MVKKGVFEIMNIVLRISTFAFYPALAAGRKSISQTEKTKKIPPAG